MEYLRCILVLTLLGVISHTESLSLKGNTSFPCGTMETITCKVDSASAIPATLTWKKDTLTFTECDDGGSKITCTQSVKQGKYITADYTKKEYYITFNTSKLTDSGVWECSDVSSSSQLPIVVTPSPVAGNLTQPSTDGRLNVTSPCFASSTSIDLDWYCKDSSSNEHKLTQIQAATNSVVSCAVDDCTGAGYIRHTVEATFEQSPSCTIPVIAYLKAGSFSSSIELPGACIKAPNDWKGRWAVVGLFSFFGVQVIFIIIVCIVCICGLGGDIYAFVLLMRIVNYFIYIAVVWSAIMVGLIYRTKDKEQCTEITSWCEGLAISTLVPSGLSLLVQIWLMIYCCFADPKPGTIWEKLKHYGKSLIKLLGCGKPMDETELKDVAVVHAIGTIIGIPLAIVIYCQEPDTKDPGEHSHGQSTGHSDRGGDKRVGVSKRNDEHSKILMSTSGNANQQPRVSGAVSRTDIELTEGNYAQEKPVLRAQPPLPGISKSHQQLDEPHNKKTRGLSSNFEDPNSLPQFEARKHSLAPINATAEGDSDSTARKKKKKKKKKEGSDTARSDED